MTSLSPNTENTLFYPIGTVVPSFGTVQAIKMGEMNTRDYLLLDDRGITTWLDELAIDAILKPKDIKYE